MRCRSQSTKSRLGPVALFCQFVASLGASVSSDGSERLPRASFLRSEDVGVQSAGSLQRSLSRRVRVGLHQTPASAGNTSNASSKKANNASDDSAAKASSKNASDDSAAKASSENASDDSAAKASSKNASDGSAAKASSTNASDPDSAPTSNESEPEPPPVNESAQASVAPGNASAAPVADADTVPGNASDKSTAFMPPKPSDEADAAQDSVEEAEQEKADKEADAEQKQDKAGGVSQDVAAADAKSAEDAAAGATKAAQAAVAAAAAAAKSKPPEIVRVPVPVSVGNASNVPASTTVVTTTTHTGSTVTMTSTTGSSSTFTSSTTLTTTQTVTETCRITDGVTMPSADNVNPEDEPGGLMASVQECCELCLSNAKCDAFVHDGTCHLKRGETAVEEAKLSHFVGVVPSRTTKVVEVRSFKPGRPRAPEALDTFAPSAAPTASPTATVLPTALPTLGPTLSPTAPPTFKATVDERDGGRANGDLGDDYQEEDDYGDEDMQNTKSTTNTVTVTQTATVTVTATTTMTVTSTSVAPPPTKAPVAEAAQPPPRMPIIKVQQVTVTTTATPWASAGQDERKDDWKNWKSTWTKSQAAEAESDRKRAQAANAGGSADQAEAEWEKQAAEASRSGDPIAAENATEPAALSARTAKNNGALAPISAHGSELSADSKEKKQRKEKKEAAATTPKTARKEALQAENQLVEALNSHRSAAEMEAAVGRAMEADQKQFAAYVRAFTPTSSLAEVQPSNALAEKKEKQGQRANDAAMAQGTVVDPVVPDEEGLILRPDEDDVEPKTKPKASSGDVRELAKKIDALSKHLAAVEDAVEEAKPELEDLEDAQKARDSTEMFLPAVNSSVPASKWWANISTSPQARPAANESSTAFAPENASEATATEATATEATATAKAAEAAAAKAAAASTGNTSGADTAADAAEKAADSAEAAAGAAAAGGTSTASKADSNASTTANAPADVDAANASTPANAPTAVQKENANASANANAAAADEDADDALKRNGSTNLARGNTSGADAVARSNASANKSSATSNKPSAESDIVAATGFFKITAVARASGKAAQELERIPNRAFAKAISDWSGVPLKDVSVCAAGPEGQTFVAFAMHATSNASAKAVASQVVSAFPGDLLRLVEKHSGSEDGSLFDASLDNFGIAARFPALGGKRIGVMLEGPKGNVEVIGADVTSMAKEGMQQGRRSGSDDAGYKAAYNVAIAASLAQFNSPEHVENDAGASISLVGGNDHMMIDAMTAARNLLRHRCTVQGFPIN